MTEEVRGDWRRLHTEELHNLYASPDITRVITSRRMRCVGHAACMGDIRNVYIILVGISEWKRQGGTPRRRSKDNIRMDRKKTGW
jgi:hypothetical protein